MLSLRRLLSSTSVDSDTCTVNLDTGESAWNWTDWQPHQQAWAVSGAAAIMAVALSFHLIHRHLSHYTSPDIQKRIIRILLMVPVYAIDSWLSFRFYREAVYIDVFRDCFEAFVLYEFLMLLLAYMGGTDQAIEDVFIPQKNNVYKWPVPLCFLRKFHAKRTFIRLCKISTLQYSIIRPLTAFIAVGLEATQKYCLGSFDPRFGYFYLAPINFLSVTISMYALLTFYVITKERLKDQHPVMKFLSIKFVIFLTFWQSLVVSGLIYVGVIKETSYWSTENVANGVQDFLVCVEMLFASIMHLWAFDYTPYASERTPIFKSFLDAINPHDVLIEGRSVLKSHKKSKKTPLAELDMTPVTPSLSTRTSSEMVGDGGAGGSV